MPFWRKNQFAVDAVHDGAAAAATTPPARVRTTGDCAGRVMMPKLDWCWQVLQRACGRQGVRHAGDAADRQGRRRTTASPASTPGRTIICPSPLNRMSYCRVRAMLRRGGTYQPTVLAFGDVTLDPGSGVLTCCGQSVRLSGREFQVMELFLRSPQVVLSADRIMERVWGWDSEAEINVVWVHISNLRKKLRSIGSHVTIRASRGLGYLLEVEV